MPRHPVHELLAYHSYQGTEPTAAELDELRLAPADRAAVVAAGRKAAFTYAGGDRGSAREYALQRSYEIVSGLSAEQQDPRYLRPDPNAATAGLSPAELAELVPR
jgi:hypothetical protein